MKKLIYSSLAFIALVFFSTSCSRSDNSAIPDEDPGTPAVMTIRFEQPMSRTVGAPVYANESAITQGMVFVFNSSTGFLDGTATFTSVTAPVTVHITAGVRDVYVVANADPANFSTVAQVSDLYNITNKCTFESMTGTNLPMSGYKLAVQATSATVASPATATVPLNFICGRVTIQWDLSQLPTYMTGFTVKDAYLLNVKSSSDYFSSASTVALTSNVSAYLYGKASIQGSSGTYLPALTYTNTYNAGLDLTDVTTNGNNNNYFYVMENSVVASPTLVVIEGTFTENGVITTYYYPIVINGSLNSGGNNSSAISRGNAYNVKAIIKGFGNDDPYNPIVNANLDVTINTATWIPQNITQTFN